MNQVCVLVRNSFCLLQLDYLCDLCALIDPEAVLSVKQSFSTIFALHPALLVRHGQQTRQFQHSGQNHSVNPSPAD